MFVFCNILTNFMVFSKVIFDLSLYGVKNCRTKEELVTDRCLTILLGKYELTYLFY